MTVRRITAAAAALTLGLALTGCVTLFPKTKPVQLYRFGDHAAAGPAADSMATFSVLGVEPTFTRAAEGDRILTVTGEETAYIADARWVAPAAVLFSEAETRAFEAAGGPARLVKRSDVASPRLALRLDVENFEVSYPKSGPRSPTVVVQVRGVLIRSLDRQVVAERTFTSRIPAGDNRLANIVRAYDSATAETLGKIVEWTNTQGAGG
jgi:cholesterol transport system auxiliary component